MRQNSNTAERRSFLKTTGAAASVALCTEAVTASSAADLQFVEVGFEHDLSMPEGTDLQPEIISNDDPAPYLVRGDTLQLTPLATDELRQTLSENDRVVKATDFTTFPRTVTPRSPTRFPAIETATDLRPTKCISLVNELQMPSVTIEDSGVDEVSILADDRETVRSDEEKRLGVGRRSVRVNGVTSDGTSTTETAVLSSRLVVRNHGRLSVAEP